MSLFTALLLRWKPISITVHTKFLAGSMHLTFIVTRSFLRLSSYMVSLKMSVYLKVATCIVVVYLIVHVSLPVVQYFLSPLLVAHGFFPALLSNLLFVVAISYYHYLNFLGYDGTFKFYSGTSFCCICALLA
jgi:hypothetical protein